MDVILDSVRNNLDKSWERLHLLTRQDLHNVKRDFSINTHERLHSNDATSVLLWVQQMRKQTDNPVLFFKQQGIPDNKEALKRDECLLDDDFMLVIMTKPQEDLLKKLGSDRLCIDSTHGTTGKCIKQFFNAG